MMPLAVLGYGVLTAWVIWEVRSLHACIHRRERQEAETAKMLAGFLRSANHPSNRPRPDPDPEEPGFL